MHAQVRRCVRDRSNHVPKRIRRNPNGSRSAESSGAAPVGFRFEGVPMLSILLCFVFYNIYRVFDLEPFLDRFLTEAVPRRESVDRKRVFFIFYSQSL